MEKLKAFSERVYYKTTHNNVLGFPQRLTEVVHGYGTETTWFDDVRL